MMRDFDTRGNCRNLDLEEEGRGPGYAILPFSSVFDVFSCKGNQKGEGGNGGDEGAGTAENFGMYIYL